MIETIEGVNNATAGWGIGQGKGEEIDEGEEATTATMTVITIFSCPARATFVDHEGARDSAAHAALPWPPLLRRGDVRPLGLPSAAAEGRPLRDDPRDSRGLPAAQAAPALATLALATLAPSCSCNPGWPPLLRGLSGPRRPLLRLL